MSLARRLGPGASVQTGMNIISATSGRDSIFLPSGGARSDLRGCLFFHGANGRGSQATDTSQQRGISRNIRLLVRAGITVISSDWGGLQHWANDGYLTAAQAGWTYLKTLGVKQDMPLLYGASMGTLAGLRFIADSGVNVAGFAASIAAVDIDDLRDNNKLSTQAPINTAWGLALGSTSASVAVPARGRPLFRPAADFKQTPMRFYGSSADTVARWASVGTLVTALGGTATAVQVSSTLDHSDAAVLAEPVYGVRDFLLSKAR